MLLSKMKHKWYALTWPTYDVIVNVYCSHQELILYNCRDFFKKKKTE